MSLPKVAIPVGLAPSEAVLITLHFSSKLKNGTNKAECYITLGWKALPGINTVAYCARLKVTEKMKYCAYDTRSLP